MHPKGTQSILVLMHPKETQRCGRTRQSSSLTKEETLKLARQVHFKHIDTWRLQLSSQTGEPKYEPIFIFQK